MLTNATDATPQNPMYRVSRVTRFSQAGIALLRLRFHHEQDFGINKLDDQWIAPIRASRRGIQPNAHIVTLLSAKPAERPCGWPTVPATRRNPTGINGGGG